MPSGIWIFLFHSSIFYKGKVIRYCRYSQQEKLEWIKLYSEGLTIQDIVNKHEGNPGWNTVSQVLHQVGISPRDLIAAGERRSRKGGYRRFSFDEEEKIVVVYQESNSLEYTAKQFQCCVDTVRSIMKRKHLDIRPRGNMLIQFTEQQQNIILNLWENGCSQWKIAQDLGVGQSKIGYFLMRQGKTLFTRKAKGERHGQWKGGRVKIGEYIGILLQPDNFYFSMTEAGSYVLEHRLVMAEFLGRPLMINETVHHIDGDKRNNKLENLQLRIGNHGKHTAFRCKSCGSTNIEPIPLT